MAEGGECSGVNKLKRKRLDPVKKINAKSRVLQFPDDLYEDGEVLFCKFCQHSVEYTRVDTIKDHLKSKTHKAKKSAKSSSSSSMFKQTTVTSIVKSKDMRDEFILDFLKMCTLADIPVDKVDKIKPFLEKHCRQGGSVPCSSTLRSLHLPRLFQSHFYALKNKLQNEKVSIIADETTDCRDKSILNIIAKVKDKSFLIDVVTLTECNHKTLSQACIRAVGPVGISYDDVMAFVSDSAPYCKKAHREVLSNIFTKSFHVLCFAHILNLVGEVFSHWPSVDNVAQLNTFVKSALFKKPGRKQRFLQWLADCLPKPLVKLPPEPVSTRWNSWFNAAMYHSSHVQVYEGFFKQEKSCGIAVDRVLELVDNSRLHRASYHKLLLNLQFVNENCVRLISALTSLEETKSPLACIAFNTMEDVRNYLLAGCSKTAFGQETDRLLSELEDEDRKQTIIDFQSLFQEALKKLNKHLDVHPVYDFYKAARLFDPRQLPCIDHSVESYSAIQDFKRPSSPVLEEFLIYVNYKESLPSPFCIESFWNANSTRFPELFNIAQKVIWMPVTSVDVERSFSQYKHLLNDRRESLTPEHTKQLTMLYYNGDVEKRF